MNENEKIISVCILTSVHPPFDVRIFRKEANALVKAGYDVTLIAQDEREWIVDGVKIINLRKPRSRIERMTRTVVSAFQKAFKIKADVYHLHDPELLPVGLFLRCLGKKVIYDIHEDYITSIQQKKYLPRIILYPLASFIGFLEKIFVSCFSGVIIAEKYYAERFPKAIPVLNYPILNDSNPINSLAPSVYLSKKYRWCLYTGVISPDRGALNHINVMTKDNEIGICMIGRCESGLYNALFDKIDKKCIARDRLVIVGKDKYVQKNEMVSIVKNNSWLAGLAVFPKTAHYEKKELTKLFEYMQDGLPIIASNFPVWRELIEECKCGLLVQPDNHQELVEAANYLIANPDERSRMSANGRKSVFEKYNWDVESTKLINFYEKLIAS